jgi:hypothetical protein
LTYKSYPASVYLYNRLTPSPPNYTCFAILVVVDFKLIKSPVKFAISIPPTTKEIPDPKFN